VHAELRARGRGVSRKRVARLMRHRGLAARRRRRYRVTTDSRHPYPGAANVLARQFTAPAPDAVCVPDITYIPTGEGWLYLAAILDLYSRSIVGWARSDRLTRQLAPSTIPGAAASLRPR